MKEQNYELLQEMDSNPKPEQSNAAQRRAEKCKQEKEKFQSEICAKLSSEFDSKLSEKLKSGVVTEEEFKELKSQIGSALQAVKEMSAEMKKQKSDVSGNSMLVEADLERVLEKVMLKADSNNNDQSLGTQSKSKNSCYSAKGAGSRLKYGAIPKRRNKDEVYDFDAGKYSRLAGETRIQWVQRLLLDNASLGKPFRDTIKGINIKLNEDLAALGLEVRKASLDPNQEIKYNCYYYFQSNSCKQDAINGTHQDTFSEKNKRAYLHPCILCAHFVKAGCPHFLTQCHLLQDMDNLDNDMNYCPVLVYKKEQMDAE